MRQKYIDGFHIGYCFIAFLMPASVLTVTRIITNLVMGASTSIVMPSMKKMMIIAWALIAEELGWY